MKSKIKYLSAMLTVVFLAIVLTACSSGNDAGNASSEIVSSDESSSEILSSQEAASSEVSSAVSSEIMSSAMTSSKAVTSSSPSSKSTKVESKAEVSLKAPTSSQSKPKPVSSQSSKATSKPISDNKPDFGELMDEAAVDAIIAEGIEYANSKGMTWYEDFTVEGSGYYNPAFSGDGAEIFKRDLFYHIDQVYDLSVNDSYYKEGNGIAYKVVKGEFEKGYWYGYVLY